MKGRICDICLLQKNTVTTIAPKSKWSSCGWTHSEVRRIHMCHEHQSFVLELKKLTAEGFKQLVAEIDSKYEHLAG